MQAVRLLTGGSPGLVAQGQRKDIAAPGAQVELSWDEARIKLCGAK